MCVYFVKSNGIKCVLQHFFSEQSPAEEKKQKEEKKRYLLRKLSFRPTVEELKEKKVIKRRKKFPCKSLRIVIALSTILWYFTIRKLITCMYIYISIAKDIAEFKSNRYFIVSYLRVLFSDKGLKDYDKAL